MLWRRLQTIAVIGMAIMPTIPIAVMFISRNVRWLNGASGAVIFAFVLAGLLIGLFDGIVLAIARKNPLWLIATASALCTGYLWKLIAIGVGMGNMH